jgi:hypothetical protein
MKKFWNGLELGIGVWRVLSSTSTIFICQLWRALLSMSSQKGKVLTITSVEFVISAFLRRSLRLQEPEVVCQYRRASARALLDSSSKTIFCLKLLSKINISI